MHLAPVDIFAASTISTEPFTKGVFIKSLKFPGSGQRQAGEISKGDLITALQATALVGVLYTSIRTHDKAKMNRDAQQAYENLPPIANREVYKLYNDVWIEKYDDYNSSKKWRSFYLVIALGIYSWNAIDAYHIEHQRWLPRWLPFVNLQSGAIDIESNLSHDLPLVKMRVDF